MENSVQKFLSQSYINSLKNYEFTISNQKQKSWDYVVITSSNEKQASFFTKQIEIRKNKKLVPPNAKFLVIPDFEGKRVGSGGATLSALIALYNIDPDFLNKKILLIHSGGDSKRIPQYSSCGKLFSPIPRLLFNQFRSTLFDELLIEMSSIADREENGMLVIPGDTEFVFNPLQVDFDSCDAASLSLKVSADTGKDHGVFLSDSNHFVRKFLHKLPVPELKKLGSVDKDGNVYLDTGFIWLSKKIVGKLFSLLLTNGKISKEKVGLFINDKVRLSFYADFIYPMAKEADEKEYQRETPEGVFSKELLECRSQIWSALHGLTTKIIQLEPSLFIHFGTMPELINTMTVDIDNLACLSWQKNLFSLPKTNNFASSLSIVSNSTIGNNSYIEDSTIKNSKIGFNSIVSSCDLNNKIIPDSVMINTLKLQNGKFVTRIIGITDNPKSTIDGPFLGSSLRKIAKNIGVAIDNLSNTTSKTIWNSNIFPECDNQSESIDFALFLFKAAKDCVDEKQKNNYLKIKRYSFESSFNFADTDYLLKKQTELFNSVASKQLINDFKTGVSLDKLVNQCLLLDANELINNLLIESQSKECSYILQSKIYLFISKFLYAISKSFGNHNYEYFEEKNISNISQTIEKEHFLKFPKQNCIFKPISFASSQMPLRVNFCGSPSDAAPYCLEFGGTELNASILLNGQKPISTTIKHLAKNEIVFTSIDLNKSITIKSIDSFKQGVNLKDFSLLYRSTVIASGLFSFDKIHSFEELMVKTGGGFEITTSVNVPKGSGLGTSSLLIASILKTLSQYFDVTFSNQEIYSQTFLTEQLMTTGGGWQDQVGGFTPGLKLITTKPGPNQCINIDYANLDQNTKKCLDSRFVLIFSGQRRLAKNVLKQEMTNLFSNNKLALDTAKKIQELCVIMKYELEKNDIDSFAKHITEQFNLVQNLDEGATNSCINYIFDVCSDLICGQSICGAGGGGFLMVILKNGVTKEDLINRIDSAFHGCGVSVWNSSFEW